MTQTSMALALGAFSFMLTVIWGEPMLRVLRHFKIGKLIRVEGPQRHFEKLGTPTMGGWLIILPVALITTLLNAASLLGLKVLGLSVYMPVLTLLTYGVLGSIDDWEGIRGKRRVAGMRARTKFALQLLLAGVIAFGLHNVLDVPELFLPAVKGEVELGAWYLPTALFLIVGTSNAVNLTDGLDGLAGLISATAFATYGAIAILQGQIFLARFCFTLTGALFGFLWFNVHPAQLFMGDTGSLALGATLAVVALMSGQWALLPVIAVIPLATTLSVILQTSYFKYTRWRTGEGKRIFKMAPLHHHFELSGWSETQVVQRFWLISLLAAMLGFALAVV
ncbi:MAG TPA: phospho-N-acetylmuramoyl-pentapeptide-transferase [Chloroflexi bacterium]|nr:phospho-N-acetylmuramoyl-pentapeptide-transferase [Chloroflexota bacterium]